MNFPTLFASPDDESTARLRRLLVSLGIIAVLATPCLRASDPPPLPKTLPPQDPPARVTPWKLPVLPAVPLTRQLINQMPVSPTTRDELLSEFNAHAQFATEATDGAEFNFQAVAPPRTRPAVGVSGAHEGFLATTDTTLGTTRIANANAGGDAVEDREPTVVVISNNIGTEVAVAPYMYFVGALNKVTAVKATNFGTFTAAPLQFTTPSNWAVYERQGDPAVAANPYASGYNPFTIYAATTMHHFVNGAFDSGAIGIWAMDTTAPNPSWRQVQPIAGTCCPDPQGTQVWIQDKPSLTVSQYPGALGWVWAAVVYAHQGVDSTISVWADQGSNYWHMMTNIPNSSGPAYQSPQVMVDPTNGYVYVAWLDWVGQRMYMTRSVDRGGSWAVPVYANMYTPAAGQTAGARQILGSTPANPDTLYDGTHTHSITARTELVARFNTVDHTIGLVWHRRETTDTTGPTDVVFRRFTPSSTWDNNQFGPITRVTSDAMTARDQWNPGLDFNTLGQYMVTYYSKYGDTATNRKYQIYASKLAANGTVISTDVMYSPTMFANATPLYRGTVFTTLGEYKDVWYWAGKWYTSFEYIPNADDYYSGQSDIYVSQILP